MTHSEPTGGGGPWSVADAHRGAAALGPDVVASMSAGMDCDDCAVPPSVNSAMIASDEHEDDVPGPAVVRVESFEQFYRVEYRRAVRLAVVLTGSAAVAEDLVQDAMADAHRMWKRLASFDNVQAWLRRAIVNRSISRRRRLAVAARGTLRLQARQSTTATDVALSDWELWGRVRALPDRQAQLIALVYVDELTIAQAAVTLGIAAATAKTHLARAKQRLARDLADWSTQ